MSAAERPTPATRESPLADEEIRRWIALGYSSGMYYGMMCAPGMTLDPSKHDEFDAFYKSKDDEARKFAAMVNLDAFRSTPTQQAPEVTDEDVIACHENSIELRPVGMSVEFARDPETGAWWLAKNGQRTAPVVGQSLIDALNRAMPLSGTQTTGRGSSARSAAQE